MNTYVVDLDTKITTVYMKLVWVDVTMFGLKDQLSQINHRLNHKDKRMMNIVEYRRPQADSNGSFWFTEMKVRNDDDVRTMFFNSWNAWISIFFLASITLMLFLSTTYQYKATQHHNITHLRYLAYKKESIKHTNTQLRSAFLRK